MTVAGLGGEPDYEQRFTGLAKDLDKLLKASSSDAHVYTLMGDDATRARMTEVLGTVAHQAKPQDDFVLILIGHGSFDGVEYKFNLVGPDISGGGVGHAVRPHPFPAPTDRQYDQLERRLDLGSRKARPRGDRGNEVRNREKCDGLRALLGRGFARSDGRYRQEQTRSARLRHFSMRIARRRIFIHRRSAWRPSMPSLRTPARANPCARLRTDSGEGLLLANFAVVRMGAAQQATNDPAKRALFDKKEELEQKIDVLKYQKAAMDPDDYKAAAHPGAGGSGARPGGIG